MKHPDISSQDFTTKKNDDTIKVSDNTTIKNNLTESAGKLSSSFKDEGKTRGRFSCLKTTGQ